jgi:hypothetical protein
MRPIPILVLAATLGLAGCAAAGTAALPVCDGHHRRSANPNGSVLDPATAQPPAPAAAPATPASASSSGCGA